MPSRAPQIPSKEYEEESPANLFHQHTAQSLASMASSTAIPAAQSAEISGQGFDPLSCTNGMIFKVG
jgi:hypothetical protein